MRLTQVGNKDLNSLDSYLSFRRTILHTTVTYFHDKFHNFIQSPKLIIAETTRQCQPRFCINMTDCSLQLTKTVNINILHNNLYNDATCSLINKVPPRPLSLHQTKNQTMTIKTVDGCGTT